MAETAREVLYLDDLLQTLPGVLEGLHGEPGVGVDAHVEAEDLLVQLRQLVEVNLSRTQGRLELFMGLTQRLTTTQGEIEHKTQDTHDL